jgi:polyisoprenoid-binding protein YceI
MAETTTATAEVSTGGLPEVGTYEIDQSHSMVEFVSRHLMVTKVRGGFTSFSGTITVADPPEQSSVEVTIDATSIDTRDAKRDEHLRGADFFDVENHPTLTFRSTAVEVVGGDKLRVTGDLTILGQTRPVTLDATFDGSFSDPWGGQRIAFEARTEVDREQWGLNWNVALETGGVLVGKKVRLDLTVEAVKK